MQKILRHLLRSLGKENKFSFLSLNLKIILVIFFLAAIPVLAKPQFVSAAPSPVSQEALDQLNAAAGAKGANLGSHTDPRIVVANIIKILLGIIGTIFLALTVYAGFLWMTAAGEEDNIKKAKGLLSSAVIGLGIILAAYSITYFVSNVLLKGTTGNSGAQNQNNNADYCLQNPVDPNCAQ